MTFDPNVAAEGDSGIFGLPYSAEESALVIVPVPWEATTSYGGGTSQGPRAVLKASHQVDLFDGELGRIYEPGLHLLQESPELWAWSKEAKALARHESPDPDQVNALCEKMNTFVETTTRQWLKKGKTVAILGGDHSVPFGAMKALAERGPFGVLHFDAHSDTRNAYEGFTWSHASIFRNVLDRLPQVERLVQVGIRDFCEEEWVYCQAQGERVRIFLDADLARRRFRGESWAKMAEEMVEALPQKVWVSFDIDGLDPRLCPHTGTPVPGGLDFHEANYLIGQVVRSGRTLVGFDLNEVAPDPQGQSEWDANVGARLLYKLCGWTLYSQGKVRLSGLR